MVSSFNDESRFFLTRSFWGELSRRVPRSQFHEFFDRASLDLIPDEEGNLERVVVLVGSNRIREAVQEAIYQELIDTAREAFSRGISLNLEVAEEGRALDSIDAILLGVDPAADPILKAHPESGGASGDGGQPPFEEISSPLNPDLTFDRFLIGGSNRIAQAITLSAVESLQKGSRGAGNFALLISTTGLGKSHLLHAAGNYIRSTTSFRVLFLNGEELYEHLGGSRPHDDFVAKSSSFRKKLSYYDALIVDGIGFIGRGNHIQEAFNQVLDTFTSRDKLVLLSSDIHPRSIPKISERTHSRLAQATTQEIQAPEENLMREYLVRSAREAGLDLKPPLLDVLVDGCQPDFRHLQRVIQDLISMGPVDPVDPDSDPEPGEPPPSVILETGDIIKTVAHHYGKKISDMKSKRREKSLVRARQVAMYLCRSYSERSFEEIGSLFGNRNHATVIYAVNKIKRLLDDDSVLRNEVLVILKRLNFPT